MIQFNLFSPPEDKVEILSRRSPEFNILAISYNPNDKKPDSYYFLIEAPEEEMLYFRLKYGNNNVWKR